MPLEFKSLSKVDPSGFQSADVRLNLSYNDSKVVQKAVKKMGFEYPSQITLKGELAYGEEFIKTSGIAPTTPLEYWLHFDSGHNFQVAQCANAFSLGNLAAFSFLLSVFEPGIQGGPAIFHNMMQRIPSVNDAVTKAINDIPLV